MVKFYEHLLLYRQYREVLKKKAPEKNSQNVSIAGKYFYWKRMQKDILSSG